MADTVDPFDDLDAVTVVVLTDNLDEEFGRVADPDRIAALGRWLADRSDRWVVPDGAPRIAAVRLNLYADENPVGNLGLGNRVLGAHGRGQFCQQEWTGADRRELFELLGVTDPRDS